MKVSNETKVGALTAIAITVLILGYNYMKGKEVFSKRTTYYVKYNEVEGLVASNPVMVSGYRVGRVTRVNLLPQDSMKVMVEIEITGNIQVNIDDTAKIYDTDFFGGKAIELVLSGNGPLAENNDTLRAFMEPSITSSVAKTLAPLKEKTENIMTSLDSILGGQSGENIRATLGNLRTLTGKFAQTSSKLDQMVDAQSHKLDEIFANVQSITNNLKNNEKNINKLISNLKSVSDTLAAADLNGVLTQAKNALKEVAAITEKINKGEGSVGLLVNNPELYNNLKSSAKSLDELLKDLKEHPKRYVHFSIFGKKDKK